MHYSEAGYRYPLATPKWFFRSVVYRYRSTITLRAHYPLLNPRHSRRCSSKYFSSPFQRGLPRASSRTAFSLAVRAEVARAIHEFFPHDRCTAAVARFERENFMNRRSEEHTSELQSRGHLVCRLLLEKKRIRRKLQNRKIH